MRVVCEGDGSGLAGAGVSGCGVVVVGSGKGDDAGLVRAGEDGASVVLRGVPGGDSDAAGWDETFGVSWVVGGGEGEGEGEGEAGGGVAGALVGDVVEWVRDGYGATVVVVGAEACRRGDAVWGRGGLWGELVRALALAGDGAEAQGPGMGMGMGVGVARVSVGGWEVGADGRQVPALHPAPSVPPAAGPGAQFVVGTEAEVETAVGGGWARPGSAAAAGVSRVATAMVEFRRGPGRSDAPGGEASLPLVSRLTVVEVAPGDAEAGVLGFLRDLAECNEAAMEAPETPSAGTPYRDPVGGDGGAADAAAAYAGLDVAGALDRCGTAGARRVLEALVPGLMGAAGRDRPGGRVFLVGHVPADPADVDAAREMLYLMDRLLAVINPCRRSRWAEPPHHVLPFSALSLAVAKDEEDEDEEEDVDRVMSLEELASMGLEETFAGATRRRSLEAFGAVEGRASAAELDELDELERGGLASPTEPNSREASEAGWERGVGEDVGGGGEEGVLLSPAEDSGGEDMDAWLARQEFDDEDDESDARRSRRGRDAARGRGRGSAPARSAGDEAEFSNLYLAVDPNGPASEQLKKRAARSPLSEIASPDGGLDLDDGEGGSSGASSPSLPLHVSGPERHAVLKRVAACPGVPASVLEEVEGMFGALRFEIERRDAALRKLKGEVMGLRAGLGGAAKDGGDAQRAERKAKKASPVVLHLRPESPKRKPVDVHKMVMVRKADGRMGWETSPGETDRLRAALRTKSEALRAARALAERRKEDNRQLREENAKYHAARKAALDAQRRFNKLVRAMARREPDAGRLEELDRKAASAEQASRESAKETQDLAVVNAALAKEVEYLREQNRNWRKQRQADAIYRRAGVVNPPEAKVYVRNPGNPGPQLNYQPQYTEVLKLCKQLSSEVALGARQERDVTGASATLAKSEKLALVKCERIIEKLVASIETQFEEKQRMAQREQKLLDVLLAQRGGAA